MAFLAKAGAMHSSHGWRRTNTEDKDAMIVPRFSLFSAFNVGSRTLSLGRFPLPHPFLPKTFPL